MAGFIAGENFRSPAWTGGVAAPSATVTHVIASEATALPQKPAWTGGQAAETRPGPVDTVMAGVEIPSQRQDYEMTGPTDTQAPFPSCPPGALAGAGAGHSGASGTPGDAASASGAAPPGLGRAETAPELAHLPSGTALKLAPDRLITACWCEWTEDTVLANLEYIQAQGRSAASTAGTDPGMVYQSLASLKTFLGKVGYSLDAQCPWRALGLDPDFEACSAPELVEDRTRRAGWMLTAALEFAHWSATDRNQIQAYSDKLAVWRATCIKQLPIITREQKKRTGHKVYPFMEPPVGLEEWITCYLGGLPAQRWASALHLSDILHQGIQLGLAGFQLSVQEARSVSEDLGKSKEWAARAVERHQDANLILWAPKETEHLNRLLAHLQLLITGPMQNREFIIVADREPTMQLQDPMFIHDVWKSPLLQDKWKHIIVDAIHLAEPALMTVTVQGGVATMVRGLSLFRISADASATPKVGAVSWRPKILSDCTDQVILVEVEAAHQVEVRKGLRSLEALANVSWEGPVRSPGSQGDQRRLVFRINASKQEISELGLHMLIQRMKQLDYFKDATIGAESLINDRGAMILEVSSMRAIHSLKDIIGEAIVVSPTELLITTVASQMEWQTRLTRIWQDDPSSAVLQLRWRRCNQNGRPWAKPRMLDGIVRAAARGARTGGNDESLGQIVIQGPLGARPELLLSRLMEAISSRIGTAMTQAQPQGKPLKDYQWRLQLSAEGLPTGRVDIRLPTLADLERVRTLIQMDVIEINGSFVPIQMHTEALVQAPFRR